MKQVQAQQPDDAAFDELVGWVRERDDEQRVELWNEVTGEMEKPHVARVSARVQAGALVAAALQRVAKARAGDAPDAPGSSISETN
jgi:hypothetical protein